MNKTIYEPFLNSLFCAWGWATWNSKFDYSYNPDLNQLSFGEKLTAIFRLRNYDLFKQRYTVLNKIINGKLDTWDVQLQWNIILNNKKVLTPHINLIYNNGLDDLAATQKRNYKGLLFTPTKEFDFKSGYFIKNLRYVPDFDIAVHQAPGNFQRISMALANKTKAIMLNLIKILKLEKPNSGITRIFILFTGLLTYYFRKPIINLAVVGEQKSGTSSIFDLLRNHPQIAAGKKKEKHILYCHYF
jgi:hypothetical protein